LKPTYLTSRYIDPSHPDPSEITSSRYTLLTASISSCTSLIAKNSASNQKNMFSYAESVFPGMSEPLLVAALGFRDTGQKSDRQTDSVEDPDSESENKGILFDRQTGFFCKGKMLQLLKSHQKNTLLGEYLPPKESHSDGQHRDAYSIAFYSCECFRN
jgi:hypothetical protein